MANKNDRARIRTKVDELIELMGLDPTEWDVDFGEEGVRIETIGGKTFSADRLPVKVFEDAVDLATSCFRFIDNRKVKQDFGVLSEPSRPADFVLAPENVEVTNEKEN